MEGLTRSQLAKQTGISPATIRYYEETGVLPHPCRLDNGYRIYTEDDLVKIKFIKDAKSLGYSLKEIQEALEMLGRDMDEDTIKGLVRNKIAEIEEKIGQMRRVQNMLADLLQTPQDEIHNYLQSFRKRDGR